MNSNFKNRTLLITGGLGGFGKAITKKFVNQGCKIITTTTKKRNEKNLNNFKIFHLDLNDHSSIKNFETRISEIKKIDFFINNAGINIIDEIYNIKKMI